MELLAGVAATVLSEGVRFLYEQAGEILKAWRKRRRDPAAAAPTVLPEPDGVAIGHVQPIVDSPDQEIVDTMLDARDLVEPIKGGELGVDSPAAREAIAYLRDLVQAALRAPITFEGETPHTAEVEDVHVVAERVSGRLTGVRAALSSNLKVKNVHVETGDVGPEGDVTGVDLT